MSYLVNVQILKLMGWTVRLVLLTEDLTSY